ncbi:MAG: SusE domain-containing protein [Ignavibacteriae bacterium]|nr:SusE domain-containing protein [Ignavibacteriota bacterium]
MKKIKLISLIVLLGLLIVSCESDISEVVMSSDPTEPTLADLSFTGDFNMANANGILTFTWTAADFGFASSTTYKLELSPVNDFSNNVATLITTQNTEGTAKVSDINNLLLSWNNSIGQNATVYYRVLASVTANEVVTSNVKSKVFIPFETIIDYPIAYVPGAYQGWSPGADNGRIYSYGFNSVYQGIIRFVDADNPTVDFKITPAANWDNDWGGSLTKDGNNYSGTLVAKGSNLQVEAGTYEITADVSALTISLTKTDDWGIIGSSVPPFDWSVDVDMFYNGQRKMWEITGDFNAGEFKFRANNGWDVNYGGTDGTLSAGGSNIALSEAGNYTIRFDPVNLTYTVKKN